LAANMTWWSGLGGLENVGAVQNEGVNLHSGPHPLKLCYSIVLPGEGERTAFAARTAGGSIGSLTKQQQE